MQRHGLRDPSSWTNTGLSAVQRLIDNVGEIMPPPTHQEDAPILVPVSEDSLEQAADILADLIAEAIEASLNHSAGVKSHGPACDEAELIEWLCHDTKTT